MTNEELSQLIEQEPGLSKYEIKKKLRWSMGKTDGAIRRLLASKKIFIRKIERDGRRVSLIFPIDMMPTNIVTIPKTELEIENPIWTDKAFMYALDSETIGVTGEEYEKWDDARFRNEISIKDDGAEISFGFSRDFIEFYNLEEKHYSVSIVSNRVLISITGRIIE